MALHYVQGIPYTLYGSGASAGDTSFTLTSFTQPSDGITATALTMADFGSKGFGTLEPGSTTQEEQISFTGITANANGTYTLTGVKTVGFVTPYTETSGLLKSHAGGVRFVISNTAGFYGTFANKQNEEEIVAEWTFSGAGVNPTQDVYTAPTLDAQFAPKKYVDDVAVSGAPDANTTTKGLVQLPTQAEVDARTATGSTGASLAVNTTVLRATKFIDFQASTGGTDTYAITPTPSVSALADGQIYVFEADVANTGAATLNVGGLGNKPIIKYGSFALITGDIRAGSINTVAYDLDSDSFMLQSSICRPPVSQDGSEIYAATATGNDTYAVTMVPAIPAYVNGLTLRVKLDVANTGAATLDVNGLGAIALVKGVSTALVTGDLVANQIITVVYNSTGTVFQIVQAPVSLTDGSTLTDQHFHKTGQITGTRDNQGASGSVSYAHGLGVAPKWVRASLMSANDTESFGRWTAGGTATVVRSSAPTIGVDTTNLLTYADTNGSQNGVLSSVDATNINIAWTKLLTPNAGTSYFVFEFGV